MNRAAYGLFAAALMAGIASQAGCHSQATPKQAGDPTFQVARGIALEHTQRLLENLPPSARLPGALSQAGPQPNRPAGAVLQQIAANVANPHLRRPMQQAAVVVAARGEREIGPATGLQGQPSQQETTR